LRLVVPSLFDIFGGIITSRAKFGCRTGSSAPVFDMGHDLWL